MKTSEMLELEKMTAELHAFNMRLHKLWEKFNSRERANMYDASVALSLGWRLLDDCASNARKKHREQEDMDLWVEEQTNGISMSEMPDTTPR